MAGTRIIDYSMSKTEGFYAGIISWERADGNTGRIFADVKISESHKFMSNVTDQTLEDGSSIHEHVIPQQPQVTLQLMETNSAFGSRSSGDFSGSQQLFDKLYNLWETAETLTITTQHKQYRDMVITNMPILHTAPYKNSLQISIDLKRLEFTKLETIKYESDDVGTEKAASENINGGRCMMQEPSEDFAYRFTTAYRESMSGGGGR